MKGYVKAGLIGILLGIMAVALCACELGASTGTNLLYVTKKNQVTAFYMESLDQDYYDEEELQEFVEEAVASYIEEAGKNTVVIKKFQVKNQVATLKLHFASIEDYAAFQGETLFVGTVGEALEAGYSFDGEFLKVESKALKETEEDFDVTTLEDLKVLILNEKINVKVDGSI